MNSPSLHDHSDSFDQRFQVARERLWEEGFDNRYQLSALHCGWSTSLDGSSLRFMLRLQGHAYATKNDSLEACGTAEKDGQAA